MYNYYRSCGKVMFSVVSVFQAVCPQRVLCDHYPWCIGPHCRGIPLVQAQLPLQTWDLRPPRPGLVPFRMWDMGPPSPTPPASEIWWLSPETCSNLFTWGLPTPHQYWHLVTTEAGMVGKRAVCILLECITRDLFKLVHFRTPAPHQYWHLVAIEAGMVGKRAVCILLECLLVDKWIHGQLFVLVTTRAAHFRTDDIYRICVTVTNVDCCHYFWWILVTTEMFGIISEYVKGWLNWLNRLNFIGKTNRLKEMLNLTILANFVYFPCISDRNLSILLKFT